MSASFWGLMGTGDWSGSRSGNPKVTPQVTPRQADQKWVEDTRAEYLLRAQLAMAFARSRWRPS